MLCCNALPGAAVGCEAQLSAVRSQSGGALKCVTRAESHPAHFTYRRPPSQPKAPSLRRGWILGRNRGISDSSGLEILLVRPEQEEGQKEEKEEEEDSLQASQWRNVGEMEAFLFDGIGVRMNAIGNGRRSESLLDKDPRRDGGRRFLTKPKYVRGPAIDKKSFIRVYYVSALRVPATECWDLSYELREHLLNWPRVNNIGRVSGDDVDEDLSNLFVETANWKRRVTGDSVRTAVFGESGTKPSGKRLVAKKNWAGGKQEILKSRKAINPVEKGLSTMLELVDAECETEPQDCTASGSIPDLSHSHKWTGPTRLLLLDEKHAGKTVSELPMAVQAVCSRFGLHDSTNANGLVNCRLTIFYEYWSMDEVLSELLPEEAHLPVKLERIGHVAELRLHPEHIPFCHLIAQVTLDKYKPTVRSVVVKRDIVHGKQYAVQLELLAGTTSLVTTGWEYGTPFLVDMAYVIWDARLGSERQRLVQFFSERDVVCDVCAGVGLVSIPASKIVRRVFANDVNPQAHACLAQNVVENKVSGRVEIFNQDVETFLSSIFWVERPVPITQLVMSHPVAVQEFLELFQDAFDRMTWGNCLLPRIHIYGISRATHPEEEFSEQIAEVLQIATCKISTNRVVEVTSGDWMVYASFILPAHFGFH